MASGNSQRKDSGVVGMFMGRVKPAIISCKITLRDSSNRFDCSGIGETDRIYNT